MERRSFAPSGDRRGTELARCYAERERYQRSAALTELGRLIGQWLSDTAC